MKADQEMANILAFDTDLIFPKTRVEMDMLEATMLADTITKLQDDLLLTGSISTFCTMATKPSQATRKSTTAASSTTNTDLVFSSATFSEKDLSFLIAQLMQAQ